ncbi:acyl-CoA dehydrogenase [Streptomyces sp. NPDC046876]|uniref:acyl-CoA dehydrogenase family protein n=1 Tax=Streptomyces sp. NPDC046876 TaxID=3155616 RepID=UPI0033BFEB75
MLARHAESRVRETYLEPLVAGRIRICYAMAEADVPGTDPFLTRTRADREADGSWRITGRKWFTSGAASADLVTVLARTGGAPGNREGLSLILVPTDSPGFRIVRELPVLGAAGQYEIELGGVNVPGDHLIGEEGEVLTLGRTLRSLRWLGQAQRAFDLMCERAATRSGSRGPLADHQLVQQHVFDALLALRTTRPLVPEAVALPAWAGRRLRERLRRRAAARGRASRPGARRCRRASAARPPAWRPPRRRPGRKGRPRRPGWAAEGLSSGRR